MELNQVGPIGNDSPEHTERTIFTLITAAKVTSWPSPFNNERLFSGFLATCNQLLETTSAMFLPAGEWLIHKGYWTKDEVNDGNSMSIRVDFDPDTKQAHQYIVRFSTVQSGEQQEILQIEYDSVSKAIVLVRP